MEDAFDNLTQSVNQHTLKSSTILQIQLQEFKKLVKESTMVEPGRFSSFVINFCHLVPLEKKSLIGDFCETVKNLLRPRYSTLEVDEDTSSMLVLWLLNIAKNGHLTEEGFQIIFILIKKKSVPTLERLTIAKTIEKLINEKIGEPLHELLCIEALTSVGQEEPPAPVERDLITSYSILYQFLEKHSVQDNENHYELKRIIVCLRGMKNLVRGCPSILEKNIRSILGIVKTFMLYNVIDYMKIKPLKPTVLNMREEGNSPAELKNSVKTSKQKRRKCPQQPNSGDGDGGDDGEDSQASTSTDHRNPPTSDSDFSDLENEFNLEKLMITIRKTSLEILLDTLKATRRNLMFSFWTGFYPEKLQTNEHYLTTCILKEPNTNCKLLALNVIHSMVSSSKYFLMQADKGTSSLSFTPFSAVIGFTIVELYKCLSFALNEKSIPILTQLLKCISVLVQATPFKKLTAGLMSKVIRNVKLLVTHKDSTVQVSAFGVLECVLLSEPTIAETRVALSNNNDDEQLPWSLNLSLENIKNDVPMAIRLESFKVLCAMTDNYFFDLIYPNLKHLTSTLQITFKDRSQDVKFHSCRTVNKIGQAIEKYLCNEDDIDLEYLNNCTLFWTSIQQDLVATMNCDNPFLSAAACDALGPIGNSIFGNLTKDDQAIYISLLINSSATEKDDSVRTAAIETLSKFILYPSLGDDITIIKRLSEAINYAMDSKSSALKIKSSWGLANICKALEKFKDSIKEQLANDFLYFLLTINLKVSSGNDKIKMNIVRALGFLIYVINADEINEEFQKDLVKALEFLLNEIKTNTNIKVKWNSCNALGNILKNSTIYKHIDKKITYNALMDLVLDYGNLKVRIHAVYALSCPSTRDFYAEWYIPIWVALLKGLEKAQSITDLREYQHRDRLIESICLSLAHLTSLAMEADLVDIKEIITTYYDVLKQNMDRILENILPQKTSIFFKATQHLKEVINKNENKQFEFAVLLEIFSKSN